MFCDIIGVSFTHVRGMNLGSIQDSFEDAEWRYSKSRKKELNEQDISLDIVKGLGLAEWNKIGINKITKGMVKINRLNNQIPEN